MSQWFYVSNGQQAGPFEESQIRAMVAQGQIGPDDLVWREGMAQWVSARNSGLMAAAPVPMAQPMQLAYASPLSSESPAIDEDPGPFLKIGGQFGVPGGGRWTGTTVASPSAIYLLKRSRQASGAAYGVGGVAGVLLHKAFSKPDDVRTCSVGELPQAVRQTLDPRGKHASKDAIVLPRQAIRLLKVGSFNNVVTAQLGGEKFSMNRGLFSGGKVRRFFEGNGWTLNQDVATTMAPIHGHGLGRTFEELENKKPSTTKRVTFAVLGVLLILAIILVQILARLH